MQETDKVQLARWRLKCDALRVATYYRVTGAQQRAEERKRSVRTRARFRLWAASVRRQRQAAARVEAGGRKRTMEDGYSDTRPYKQRATQEEVTRRRLQPQRRRLGPTATCTELGKRMRDEMSEMAKRRRRGDG